MTLLQTDELSLDAASYARVRSRSFTICSIAAYFPKNSGDILCSSHITVITSGTKTFCLAAQAKRDKRIRTSSQIELTSPMSSHLERHDRNACADLGDQCKANNKAHRARHTDHYPMNRTET